MLSPSSPAQAGVMGQQGDLHDPGNVACAFFGSPKTHFNQKTQISKWMHRSQTTSARARGRALLFVAIPISRFQECGMREALTPLVTELHSRARAFRLTRRSARSARSARTASGVGLSVFSGCSAWQEGLEGQHNIQTPPLQRLTEGTLCLHRKPSNPTPSPASLSLQPCNNKMQTFKPLRPPAARGQPWGPPKLPELRPRRTAAARRAGH